MIKRCSHGSGQRWTCLPIGLVALACAMQFSTAHAATVEWIKGSDGLWSERASWSAFPGTSDAIWIPKGVVTQGQQISDMRQARDLAIGADGGLVVTSLLTLSGDLTNAGQLTMNSVLNPAANLRVTGNTWLKAGGTTSLEGASRAKLASMSSAAITVEEGHVLRASNTRLSTISLVNRGLIEATGGWLYLGQASSAGSITNQGVIRVSNGTFLRSEYTIDNSGGLIDVVSGSAGGSIKGGVIRGSGPSSGTSGIYGNTTLEGEFRFGGGSFWGSVQNNAVLHLIDGTMLQTTTVGSVLSGQGELNVANGEKVNLVDMNFGAGQTFRGSATVTVGSLTNQGRFIVQGAHGLVLDSYYPAQQIVNRGDMQVVEGSRLVLGSKTFDNTGGTLTFQGASEVVGWNGQNFSGWIVGGTVVGSGAQRVTGQQSFQDLTLNGRWVSAGDNIIGLKGRVTINGSLVVGDGLPGSGGRLNIVADTVLDGAGETVLVRGAHDSSEIRAYDFSGYSGTGKLTVGEGHTLRGEGIIHPIVRNDGLVLAEVGNGLQFNSGVINRGVMRANGAGIMVGGSGIDNQGGLIEVLEGATVHAHDGVIQGGVIRGVGEGGRLRVHELRDVTLQGSLGASDSSLWQGGSIGVSGSVTNQGVLRVGGVDQDGRGFGSMVVRGDATLRGSGVTQVGAGDGMAIMGQCCEGRLLVDAGHTLRGAGVIQSVDVTNQGSVLAQGGVLNFRGGNRLINQGLLQVDDGAELRSDGDFAQEGDAARLVLNGQLEAPLLALRGGVLEGQGVLKGDLQVGEATVKAGASTGRLTVEGDFTASGGSFLEVTLGDVLSDLPALMVHGKAFLDGGLILDVGSLGELGSTFDILRSTEGVSGEFSHIELKGTDLKASVSYLGDRVTISLVTSVPEPHAAWLAAVGLLMLSWAVRSRRK